MIDSTGITAHFRAALDAAQAADVRREADQARDTRDRLAVKDYRRQSARATAQLLVGERLRACGVAYTPELEQLAVTFGDGTLPCHWAFMLHGLRFATSPGTDGLVVERAEAHPSSYYEVANIVDLGHAVEALGGVR